MGLCCSRKNNSNISKKNIELLKYADKNTSILNEIFVDRYFLGKVVNIYDSNLVDIVSEFPMNGTLIRYKCRLYGLISKKVFGANDIEINFNKLYLDKIFKDINYMVWIKCVSFKDDEIMVKLYRSKNNLFNNIKCINDQIFNVGQTVSL